MLAASALRATATKHASNRACASDSAFSLAGITQEEASRGYPPAKDKLQAAIHRAQSVAVYRDVAASVPAGMQVWQLGRSITLGLFTTV